MAKTKTTPKPPAKTGRPQIKIDEKQVLALASMHCTMKEIAAVVGCSVDTLERRFADVIEKGRESGKASLRRTQYRLAENNAAMAIWLGKQWLGQSDRIVHEGPDGGPLEVIVKVVGAPK